MKKGVLILLALILFSTSAFALQVSFDATQGEVLPGQAASYTIHLTNDEEIPRNIRIKTIDLGWDMDKDNTGYDVSPGETVDVDVVYTPINENMESGLYGINLQAETTQTKETKLLPVEVVGFDEVATAEFSSLPIIDPRRSTIVKLMIKNNNNILLDNLQVTLQSEFFEVSNEVTVPAAGEAEVEFAINLDAETTEGDYTLTALVFKEDNQMIDQDYLYTIGKYTDVREVVEPEDSFLVKGARVTSINEGNAVVSGSYRQEYSKMSYKFTNFDPEPTTVIKDAKNVQVEWAYNLQPGETIVVHHKTNYRTPLLIALIIIAVLVAIYYFRKKNLTINKRVMVLHTKHGGGAAIIKVLITVKNVGNVSLNEVRVMDRIPKGIKAPSHFGAAKPVTVKSGMDGVRMVWHLHGVKPGQERTLSYKVESKTKLKGTAMLPGAIAKFMAAGKKVLTHSNAVSLKPKQ